MLKYNASLRGFSNLMLFINNLIKEEIKKYKLPNETIKEFIETSNKKEIKKDKIN